VNISNESHIASISCSRFRQWLCNKSKRPTNRVTI